MFARISINRMPINAMSTRFLSIQGESALTKFQQVMQEYRMAKWVPRTGNVSTVPNFLSTNPLRWSYAQCTPRRFKQEIIAAAKDSNNLIVMENMQKVLKNIGASQKLTDEELQLIFAEVGDAGAIPADRLATLF